MMLSLILGLNKFGTTKVRVRLVEDLTQNSEAVIAWVLETHNIGDSFPHVRKQRPDMCRELRTHLLKKWKELHTFKHRGYINLPHNLGNKGTGGKGKVESNETYILDLPMTRK